MNAMFCPDTASRCASPEARKSSRTSSESPSSSPSTTPSTSARRRPVVPRPTAVSMRSRSPSPRPAMPPRVPIWSQARALATTWIPWRSSHARSSKPPSSAARGSAMRTLASRMAPRGGERPSGRTSRTRSRRRRPSKATTSAGTRTAHDVCRALPTTTSSARAWLPISDDSGLRASASRRSVPQDSPRTTSTRQSATNRPTPSQRHIATSAETRTHPRSGRTDSPVADTTSTSAWTQFDPARPAHADPARSAGQCSSTTRLTGSRARAVARSAPGRYRGRRPGRRSSG